MKHLLTVLRPFIDRPEPLPERILAKASVKPDQLKEAEKRGGS
jgi:hypothetical protein